MNVAFVVWEDVELIELTGPAQIISSAAGFDEYTVGESIKPMRSRFITIVPDYTFDNCPKPDVVVVPGGRGGLSAASEQRIVDWLQKVDPGAEMIMGVCNGVVILAHAGLLDGREATGPDGHLDEALILGHAVTPIPSVRYHTDGKIVTTQSYFAAVDAALYVVKRLRGEEEAQRVAAWNNHDWQDPKQSQAGDQPPPRYTTSRYLVYRTLMDEGQDAALNRLHNLVNDPEAQDAPPAFRQAKEAHFRWLMGSISKAGRHAEAEILGRFMTAAFPDSVRARVCLAEALASSGKTSAAVHELLTASETRTEISPVRDAIASVLHREDCVTSEETERARRFLQGHPFETHAELASEDEPGTPLVVSGIVRDENSEPVEGALVHVFHADTEGRYAIEETMDEPNARLFAYIRTGADGRYEIRAVRPGAYPGHPDRPGIEWQIPAHVHYQVSAEGFQTQRFQLVFEDDPRMEPDYWRQWAKRDGNPIVSVTTNRYGVARCVCDVVLAAPN